MKFTIEKSVILEGLTNVIKAISTKNVIPILNGIMFTLKKDGLYLLASDSELTIKTFIDKKEIKNIENEGSIVVQSKYIIDIVRKMPSDLINFEVLDGLKIRIYTENNQYNLNCLDYNDYPNIKIDESKTPITLNAKELKSIINETSFAISTQELRPILTGINIRINGDLLECVATDSYRLAKKNVKLSTVTNNQIDIVIPGRNINELEKILTDDEDVIVHVFNNKVLFMYKNIMFQSNLLNGNYPNTSNLIPTDFSYIIKVGLNEFNAAIDRAALLTQGKDKNIIKMNLDGDKMVISSSSSELGRVEEKLNIETTNKEKLEISFSSKYMLEALKTMKDDEILVLLNSDNKPIIVKSVKDDTLIQLILPIKTY